MSRLVSSCAYQEDGREHEVLPHLAPESFGLVLFLNCDRPINPPGPKPRVRTSGALIGVFHGRTLVIHSPAARWDPIVGLPRGPIVVPFWGSYIESYKVIPKRNYYGASG